MTDTKRTAALIKAQEKYEKKRTKLARFPSFRLNDEESKVLKDAVKFHGGSIKDTVFDALKLLTKSLDKKRD